MGGFNQPPKTRAEAILMLTEGFGFSSASAEVLMDLTKKMLDDIDNVIIRNVQLAVDGLDGRQSVVATSYMMFQSITPTIVGISLTLAELGVITEEEAKSNSFVHQVLRYMADGMNMNKATQYARAFEVVNADAHKDVKTLHKTGAASTRLAELVEEFPELKALRAALRGGDASELRRQIEALIKNKPLQAEIDKLRSLLGRKQ